MKKLHLDENFDNVQVDVQAVASPAFVDANEEHDENKKRYEDAMEHNAKLAMETVPEEGYTGKKISSKVLKQMHLSESLFDAPIEEVGAEVVEEEYKANLGGDSEDFIADIEDIKVALEGLDLVTGRARDILDELLYNAEGLASAYLDSDDENEDVFDESCEIKENLWQQIAPLLEESCEEDSEKEELDEALNESVDEDELEVRLMKYIKKFQNHYKLSANDMGDALTSIGKSIKLLNMTEEVEAQPVKESLIYNVAKEQLNRYNEGKMGENWNPKLYVEKLVNKKYLDKSQAKSLLENVKK